MHSPRNRQPVVAPKKVLLVDDDAQLGREMFDRARAFGIHLDAIPSSSMEKALPHLEAYDAVMLSYDMDAFTGLEIAEFLGRKLPHKTLVMVAGGLKPWQERPRSIPAIRAVVSKWDGIDTMLAKTLTALSVRGD